MKTLSLILICTGLLAPYARAAETIPLEASVKVESDVCGHSPMDFNGSGVLFTRKDGQGAQHHYVLTSEHVLLQGNRPTYCHQIRSPELGVIPAKLLAADWGMGLALLELETTNPALEALALPALEQLAATSKEGDSVLIAAFPYGKTTRLIDDHGVIVDAASKMHLIPLLDHTIELIRGYGEYGMSGGPVFNADRTGLVGLLSHQYRRSVGNGPLQTLEYSLDTPDEREEHVLLISSQEATKWLESYFRDPQSFHPSFVRDPELQREGVPAVFSGGLKFELFNRGSDDETGGSDDGKAIGGKGGDGVGRFTDSPIAHPFGKGGDGVGHAKGGDGVGHAKGGDGVGHAIGGGAGASLSGGAAAGVRISLDRDDHGAACAIPSTDAQFRGWVRQTLTGSVGEGALLIEKTSDSRGFVPQEFHSLEELFYQLAHDQTMLRLKWSGPGNARLSDQRLEKIAQNLSDLAKAMQGKSLPSTAHELLDSLWGVAESILGSGGQLPSTSSLRDLLGPQQKDAWSDLYDADFDKAVNLRSLTNEISSIAGN